MFPLCRKSFEPDVQFVVMCRIVTDQTQPMNHKVKLAWLEYLRELLPLVDSAEFKDTTGTPVVYFRDRTMPLQHTLMPPSFLPFFLLSLFSSLLLLLSPFLLPPPPLPSSPPSFSSPLFPSLLLLSSLPFPPPPSQSPVRPSPASLPSPWNQRVQRFVGPAKRRL